MWAPKRQPDLSPALQAGAFRIGDTAGTLENIVHCKLHRPGSVGFVSKSGGMSNEMYNVLARASDGLYEGALPACLPARMRWLHETCNFTQNPAAAASSPACSTVWPAERVCPRKSLACAVTCLAALG